MVQIRHVIIKVDDQDKPLDFYTSVLGFVKKRDLMAGSVRENRAYIRSQSSGSLALI